MPHRAKDKAPADEPARQHFLQLLDGDITRRPSLLRAIDPGLIQRARDLVNGVEVDLDATLRPEDE